MNRIVPVIKKELRQIKRDKRTLGILLLVPAFMLVMFGYALNFDVKHISLAMLDHDKSAESRRFIENFLHTEYFDLNYYASNGDDLDKLLNDGDATVALVIPHDFSEDIAANRRTSIQVLLDGTNPTSASTAAGYISTIVIGYSEDILMETLARAGHGDYQPPIDYKPRVWFNPELESAKFLVPGLIGFILMVTAVISTSLSVVREKERGTIEQITISPLRPIELIIGKTIPYVFTSLAATLVILAVGYVLFDVSIKGSPLLLLLATLIYLTGCLGLGLLISTISSSQQVAFTIAIMATMLPTFLLSGFVFPVRNMPLPIQIITYLVPAKYFMVTLRAIMLKGVGLSACWDQFLYLIAFASITIVISTKRLSTQISGGSRKKRSRSNHVEGGA